MRYRNTLSSGRKQADMKKVFIWGFCYDNPQQHNLKELAL
jgi:hypothetical protein